MSIWIPMTKMPERIALSHCFGGLAAALVGVVEYHHRMATGGIDRFTMAALGLEVFLGFLTFTGSLMAFGKLQGLIAGAPVTWPGQNASNITMFFAALVLLVLLVLDPSRAFLFYGMGALGLLVGVLAVLPIGGAKQKLLAAQRAGLTEVFLPVRNAPDLDDVPADVLADVEVHLVADVLDVVASALEHAQGASATAA